MEQNIAAFITLIILVSFSGALHNSASSDTVCSLNMPRKPNPTQQVEAIPATLAAFLFWHR